MGVLERDGFSSSMRAAFNPPNPDAARVPWIETKNYDKSKCSEIYDGKNLLFSAVDE